MIITVTTGLFAFLSTLSRKTTVQISTYIPDAYSLRLHQSHLKV